MAAIDFESELAETYITQVRQMEAAGPKGRKNIRHRPPINKHEAEVAKTVRRRVDRVVTGYRGPVSFELNVTPLASETAHCGRCGQAFTDAEPGRLWRQVYGQTGRTDLFIHRAGCPTEAA